MLRALPVRGFRPSRAARRRVSKLPNPDTVRILSQAGYPLFTSMQACVRTIAAMARYRAVRERRLRGLDDLDGPDGPELPDEPGATG